jgi:hypothetical protein
MTVMALESNGYGVVEQHLLHAGLLVELHVEDPRVLESNGYGVRE